MAALTQALDIPGDPGPIDNFTCQFRCLFDSLMTVMELSEEVLSHLLGDQNLASLEDDSVLNGELIPVRQEFPQVSG